MIHWATMLVARREAGQGTSMKLVVSPHVLKPGDGYRSVTATSPIPFTEKFTSESPVPLSSINKGKAMAHAECCHAVCLRDRRHTGTEILSALQGHIQRWLTSFHLVTRKSHVWHQPAVFGREM